MNIDAWQWQREHKKKTIGFHQDVSGKNEKIFENAGFSFTCGRMKPEVFEYDDVIHHILLV